MSNLIYLNSEMPELGIKLLKKSLSEAQKELSKIKESEKLSFVDIGNKRDSLRKEMAFLEGEILGLQDILLNYSNRLYKKKKDQYELDLVNKKSEFSLKEKEYKKLDKLFNDKLNITSKKLETEFQHKYDLEKTIDQFKLIITNLESYSKRYDKKDLNLFPDFED